ncbi:MAG: competence type IV pilus minor pilin ComGD [Bacillota bacterium]
MENKDKGEPNGYTMIEMLLVLAISTTLLFFTSLSILPFRDSLIQKNFVSTLKADLYFLQSYAINKKERVVLQFYPYEGKYSGKIFGGKSLIERTLPEGITQVPNSGLEKIIIYPNGNTDKFGSFYYSSGGKQIKLSFQIGQGRFNVEE